MSEPNVLQRASRAIVFGRYMPLGKLLRRLQLGIRRSLRDRIALSVDCAPSTRCAAIPPQPVFLARAELAPDAGDDWCFTFLNCNIKMRGPRINWTAPGAGPAQQLWCMNLHYMEYLEGVEEAAWSRLVTDWIDANPMHGPGAWRNSWNSYALSLRVVVWLQELARRSRALPPALTQRVEASAVDQLMFLERNLETDLGGNHLIKNIKALIWASAYFAGPQAERWRRKGLRMLEREIGAQILADGVHYERSPSYHCQVFADLLECRRALKGDPFGGTLDEVLARMAQAATDLSHPDGQVALFNDAGLTMAYQPGECLDVFERIFGRRPSPRAVFALPLAGYFGLRSGGNYFVADCGRIAPDDLPAHGHGDILSFEWSVAGRRIFVDQGVFEYSAGDHRQASRSAANHNTLCFDGTDQADFFGAFRCGRRPNVEVRAWEPNEDRFVLEGAHDGFSHLKGRPIHVRRFEVEPDVIMIRDAIEGATGRRATICFLLHPSVEVEKTREGLELRQAGTRVRVASTALLETVPAAWWPDMGREQATRRIIAAMPPGASEAHTSLRIVSSEATSI